MTEAGDLTTAHQTEQMCFETSHENELFLRKMPGTSETSGSGLPVMCEAIHSTFCLSLIRH